jgi:hypothetical protein
MMHPIVDIAATVHEALQDALRTPDLDGPPRIVHQNRSRTFVEALASRLRTIFAASDGYYVLSKHFREHRGRFGLNELLYDVCVCRAAETLSAQQGQQLTYVTEAVWAVESEFAHDSREALFDFNKLVLSAAPSKLFVGPQPADRDSYLTVLANPARVTTGLVYVALVPHPADWRAPTVHSPSVYVWHESHWQNLTPAA